MKTRSFNITTKVTASKEQWKSLDNLVSTVEWVLDDSAKVQIKTYNIQIWK